ncbi:MAG: AI-2E family transporter [Planctomycetota bacterium]|nr:MAG: AI-2E family transporter [Planctomycetota bacterium]
MKRSLVRTGVVLGVFALGWFLRTVTIPLLAAYLLTLVLLPWRLLWESKLGRTGASIAVLLLAGLIPLLLMLPAVFEVWTFTASAAEASQPAAGPPPAVENLPATEESAQDPDSPQDPEALVHWVHRMQSQLEELQAQYPWLSRLESSDLQSFADGLLAVLRSVLAAIAGFLGGIVGILSSLVLIPIFVFFLLVGAPWLPHLRAEVPPDWRPRFDRIMPRIEEILRTYVTSRVMVATGKGMIYLLLLGIFQIPMFYTLALIGGGLSLLPILGPAIAFLVMTGVAFADTGLWGLVVALATYLIAEILEGYVLLPRLVGRGLGFSDFAVILVVLCGGTVAGLFGFLVAMPAVAVARVLYDEYLRPVMGTEKTA